MVLTSTEARALLEKIKAERPGDLLAASNSVAISAIEQLEELNKRFGQLLKIVKHHDNALRGKTSEVAPGTAEKTTETPAVDTNVVSTPSNGEPRTAADGEPLTPEQAALEAQMDAASAGVDGSSGPTEWVRPSQRT